MNEEGKIVETRRRSRGGRGRARRREIAARHGSGVHLRLPKNEKGGRALSTSERNSM